MKVIEKVSFILTIIGAMNYLLIGLFNFNFLAFLFDLIYVTKLIYILIGISSFISFKIILKNI